MDDFILKTGIKSKTVLERLIKLGAFRNLERHNNSKALWIYYQTKYGNGPDAKEIKNYISHLIISKQGWTEGAIAAERERLVSEYRIIYPRKKTIPKKLLNWNPEPIIDFNAVLGTIDQDFSFEERLLFQNDYLGYYIDSPLGLFSCRGDLTIAAAKSNAKSGHDIIAIEGIIVNIEYATSKNNKPYAKISTSDGMLKTSIMVWSKELSSLDKTKLVIGAGIRAIVDYDDDRNSFSIRRNTSINILKRKPTNATADERRD
jgi:DNA polymerase III alpha subunit